MRLPDLPVREALPELQEILERHHSAVLVAPPGAGKTTLVPLALLEQGWLRGGKVLMLEPRRLATRAAAHRMATLLGEEGAGGTVGYRIHMDTRVGPRTRIEVVTEGVLTRMLQSDPTLAGVGLLIFDEFHERSLAADLGLALTLHARGLFRDGLRVLVMSATLDAAPVARLLGGARTADSAERAEAAAARKGGAPGGEHGRAGGAEVGRAGRAEDDPTDGTGWPAAVRRATTQAPIVEAAGKQYAVETRYRSEPIEGWIEPPVAQAVLHAIERHEGDILVFLPGAAEIARTAERLQDAGLPAAVEVHSLFGELPRVRQDRAIAPSPPGRRKVVLATSIAETSLTIEGVRVVIDSGLMRIPRFDPGSGMTRLDTVRVTRDAADQRRGRAGRTAPGLCYRLWTEAENRGLVPHRRPEILEADLAALALELAVWGAAPGELAWLDPPPGAALRQAVELLQELEALDDDAVATEHGREMAGLGLHPRLAHMLIRGNELGLGPLACDLAALIGHRDVLRGDGRAPDADLRVRVEAMRRARGASSSSGNRPSGSRSRSGSAGAGSVGGDEPLLGSGALRGQSVARGRLQRALDEARHWRRTSGLPENADYPASDVERTGLLAAHAYPDRIGQRRDDAEGPARGGRDPGRFLLRNGRGARFLEAQPLARSPWIVATELEGSGPEARIFTAAPLSLEEIEGHFEGQIDVVEEVTWDAAARRVRVRRRRVLGALVLSEAPVRDPAPEAVAGALLAGIREDGLAALPWSKSTRQLQERLQFLHRVEPESWPDSSEEALEATLEAWLGPWLSGMKGLDDLRRLDLGSALLSRIDPKQRPRLDVLAPTHVEVPSGSRIPIDYSDPEAPALAVRIQELFGSTETPRIAGGRVPLTLKLLSPAQRPVQVTTDLASFWRQAYFDVKKDLMGRYPKHYWPDEPLDAEPTRRTKRRD